MRPALKRAFTTVRDTPGLSLACAALATGIAHLVRYHYDLSDRIGVGIALVLFVAALPLCLRLQGDMRRMRWLVLSSLALVLLGVWYHFRTEFGWFDWYVIRYHIAAGLDHSDGVREQVLLSRNAVLGFGLIILGLAGIAGKVGMGWRSDVALASVLLAANPAVRQLADMAAPVNAELRTELARHYAEPAVARVAGPPRNFVHIFLESTERTFAEDPRFADAMAPLWALEKRGLAATGMHQIAHTRWSVAGMTAAMCGVPLFPVGYVSGNDYFRLDTFMPAATCLGDILSRRGYELAYVVGADPAFAGIDKLYLGHGFTRIVGGAEIRARHPQATNAWGADDGAVFDTALDVLRGMQAAGRPFGLVVETIGGHEPNGLVANACLDGEPAPGGVEGTIRAIGCTNRLLAGMLEAAETEGLLDNTVVVLQSDHVSLDRSLFTDLAIGERRLFFAMFGDGLQPVVVGRPSSPVDVFPTLLDAIGLSPEGGRAALGVSLLRDMPTLIEQFGAGRFDQIIHYDRTLGPALWGYP